MHSTINSVRSRLPDWVSGRLRAKKFRYKVSEIPPLVPVAPEAIRLFIGPANYAGQGYRFARAVEALPGIAAVNMQRASGIFGFLADNSVPPNVFWHSRRWQQQQFDHVRSTFTHVMYEAEQPLFGNLFDRDVVAEVAALRASGVGIVMLSHGSDLRGPDLHRSRDSWSPFHDDVPRVESLRELSEKSRGILKQVAAPVLVTTPDLLADWPTASWIPVVVDPSVWANESPILARERPVVLHAPTNAWIKGSELIEPALSRLHAEGLIEYKRVEGVPANEMAELYRNSDIVLEQFRIGTYSVTAVEALAAGRLVIAHLFDDVRQHVERTVDREVPVIEATVDTLESMLRTICADRERFIEHAKLGPDFARDVHDGRRSAAVLASVLQ